MFRGPERIEARLFFTFRSDIGCKRSHMVAASSKQASQNSESDLFFLQRAVGRDAVNCRVCLHSATPWQAIPLGNRLGAMGRSPLLWHGYRQTAIRHEAFDEHSIRPSSDTKHSKQHFLRLGCPSCGAVDITLGAASPLKPVPGGRRAPASSPPGGPHA